MDTTDLQQLKDRVAISDIILRYSHALDTKNWELCRSCFTDQIETDYSDLRGDPPGMIDVDAFVEKRRMALGTLHTLHQSTNHLVTIEGDQATCHSNAIIYRWDTENEVGFHTYALYRHTLQRTQAGWKINGVRQKVIRNIGDASLHSGAKREVDR